MQDVFSYRLKQARQMKGFSMDELCSALGDIVSKQSIYKYEKGKMLPDSTILLALSDALDTDPDFFFRPVEYHISDISFRKKKTSVKSMAKIKETVADKVERYCQIENLLGLDGSAGKIHINMEIYTPDDARKAAIHLREKWDIGMDTIASTSSLLEDHDIKVIYLSSLPQFDGLSGYVNECDPIVVLNEGFCAERIRFSALHELGHLTMDLGGIKGAKKLEQLCHEFASEMLLPSETFMKAVGRKRNYIPIHELEMLQEQYGISIAALMHKAHDLKIITDAASKKFWIRYKSDKNFRDICDASRFCEVRSNKFERLVYRALSQELISSSKAASLLGHPLSSLMREM